MAAYLMAAVLGALVPGPSDEQPDGGAVQVLFLAGPIHYDILLPATAQTREALGFAEPAGVPITHPAVEWVLVGWGAERFYTTTGTYLDVNAGAIWRGVTGDRAVLRLDVLGALPQDHGLSGIVLSSAEYSALVARIAAESDTSAALDHPGFTETDAFFAARGPFHLFRTCNVWVGEVLRASGARFGAWTPTPYSVRLSLWWHQG
ncbi:hypothetical protein AIOL_003283 [Candidatus Rhodobacter oscarellae]|uniref:Uncharacterized protein n=1 Tax=Candidatus Rhodobacter oscarellae TaxID=1675527 RepID=A0A0J9E6M7_9RHOB|nr:hypothetical protein AIOL_003283 [Candidatus Rhodobacter lobularis]